MEEMHHTHKETRWGWIGALVAARAAAPRKSARCRPCPADGVVTPWDRHAPCGWSA